MTQCKLKINRNTALERNHMGDPGKEIHNVTVNTRAKSHSCIYTCTGIYYKSIKVKFKSNFVTFCTFQFALLPRNSIIILLLGLTETKEAENEPKLKNFSLNLILTKLTYKITVVLLEKGAS